MISFVNVFVKYTKEYYALSNLSFEAKRGEVVAILGPKDSGKTCILRLLAGLERADKGEIYINNIPVEKIDYRNDISMGYIPYKTNFFDKKTVYDNLKYILDIWDNLGNLQVEEKINKAVTDFKIESIVQEKIFNLSLFQKYVVSIARLSFRKLDIVLIDNIFEELTSSETKEILRLIKKYLVDKNTLVLIATSDEKIAKKMSTRIMKLNYGALSSDEKISEEEH